MKRKQNAFTIVELLIVIVVIAILSAVTVTAYNGVSSRSKSAALAGLASQLEKKIAIKKTGMTISQYCDGSSVGVCDTKANFLTYIDAANIGNDLQHFPYGSASPMNDKVNIRFDDSGMHMLWWDSAKSLWNYRVYNSMTLNETSRGTSATAPPMNFS